MSEVVIREAKIEDLEGIVHLNTALFLHDYEFDKTLDFAWPDSKYGRDYFEKSITRDGSCTLVALENEVIVGYMIAGLPETPDYVRKDIKFVELENTFIVEDYRRQGIGEKMYAEVEKWGRGKGAKMMKIEASYDNEKARNFYKKMGLREAGITFHKEL